MSIAIYQAMALATGFSTTLVNPIDIRLVLLSLVVMPTTELVLLESKSLLSSIDTPEASNFYLFSYAASYLIEFDFVITC